MVMASEFVATPIARLDVVHLKPSLMRSVTDAGPVGATQSDGSRETPIVIRQIDKPTPSGCPTEPFEAALQRFTAASAGAADAWSPSGPRTDDDGRSHPQ